MHQIWVISCIEYILKLCVLKSLLVTWGFITHVSFCCWFFMFLYKFCLCILLGGFCLCVFGFGFLLFASELCYELSKIWSSYVVLQLDLVCSRISFGLGCVFCMRFCMTNVVKVSFCFSVFVVFKFIFM